MFLSSPNKGFKFVIDEDLESSNGEKLPHHKFVATYQNSTLFFKHPVSSQPILEWPISRISTFEFRWSRHSRGVRRVVLNGNFLDNSRALQLAFPALLSVKSRQLAQAVLKYNLEGSRQYTSTWQYDVMNLVQKPTICLGIEQGFESFYCP